MILPSLDFGHLGGVAERVGDAAVEGGAEFRRLGPAPRQEQTLLAPELPPDSGEGIGERRVWFAVPGGGADGRPGAVAKACGKQRHDREQPEQARRGARDRPVRPLPLGLDTEL